MKRKRGPGKPTSYRKNYPDRAARLWAEGATDADVAKSFKVNRDTLHEWTKKHPEFADAKKKAKDAAIDLVEHSLFQRARGFVAPDVHISTHEGRVIVTKIQRHYPPDPVSCIFYLKNRRPIEWRDRTETYIGGTLAGVPEDIVKRVQQRAAERAAAKANGATNQTSGRS